jgi:hypothetical protein
LKWTLIELRTIFYAFSSKTVPSAAGVRKTQGLTLPSILVQIGEERFAPGQLSVVAFVFFVAYAKYQQTPSKIG